MYVNHDLNQLKSLKKKDKKMYKCKSYTIYREPSHKNLAIFKNSRDNHVSPILFPTDRWSGCGRTDISNYRVVLLLNT